MPSTTMCYKKISVNECPQPTFCTQRNQSFVDDFCGPSADETVLSLIDRILTLIGACTQSRPLLKNYQLKIKQCESFCSESRSSHCESFFTCCSAVKKCKEFLCCSKKPKTIEKCDNSEKVCADPFELERQCCLKSACKKLRKLCFRFGDEDCKWFWTRSRSCKGGAVVYEIFKKLNCKDPSKTKITCAPDLVFIVLPNGCLIPFQII